MSLFNRKPQLLVHIGQHHVTAYQRAGRSWSRLKSMSCDHLHFCDTDAIAEVVANTLGEQHVSAHVSIVCDSKWAPVCLIRTGPKPLKTTSLDLLIRHRLKDIFGMEAAHWLINSDYQPGNHTAIASGLPLALKQAIDHALQKHASRKHTVSYESTLAWTWNQIWRHHKVTNSSAWLVLAEQDRTIMLYRHRGQTQALQAAAEAMHTPDEATKLVQLECVRAGITGDVCAISCFTFEAITASHTPVDKPGLRWQFLPIFEANA
jgi:hypothetical protein